MSNSVSGLGSGIDFGAFVDQLMSIEKQPRVRLAATVTTQQSKMASIDSIMAKMNSITAAANKLTTSSNFFQMKATSTDETSVTAAATNSAMSGSITFTVDSVATSLSQVSSNTLSSLTDIAATGPISINGQSINIGDGSLQALVSGINATSNVGVRAAAVQVAPNQFRLQLTATTSGTAGAIAITGGTNLAALGTLNISQAGVDAQLTVGSGPGAYTVTSTSNTFSGVLPGVTLTAKKVSTTPITIDVNHDATKIADNIQALVDAANAAITEINNQTKISTTTSSTGTTSTSAKPLSGDFAISNLKSKIVSAVTGAVSGSTYGSAGNVGVSSTQAGLIAFDRAKFSAAFTADPTGVSKMFMAGGNTSDSRASFVGATTSSYAGTYAINVSQAATQATATGMVGTVTVATSNQISISNGTTTVAYDTVVGNNLTQVRDGINAALTAGGIAGIYATLGAGGGIQINTEAYGSGASFTSKFNVGDPFAASAGQDVIGDIGGAITTGVGQTLTVNDATSNAHGLSVNVTATTAQIPGPTSLGTLDYAPGIAQQLLKVVKDSTDTITGTLTTSKQAWQSLIDSENKTLASMDYSLSLREARLRSQYASLDALLGQLKAQGNSLSAKFATMSA